MPSNEPDVFSNIGSKASSTFDINILAADNRFGDELEIEDVNIDLGDQNDTKRDRVDSDDDQR